MMRHLLRRSIVALPFLLAASLGAQSMSRDSATARAADCRGFNGIYVDAWWGGADSGSRGDSSGFRFDGRTRIDTTFTFAVAERRWTRPSVNAVVLAGASSSGGTTAASTGGGAGREWHVCTGATVSGRQPTLVLRGVRGQLRLKVDLTPLASIRGGALGDSTRTPRR